MSQTEVRAPLYCLRNGHEAHCLPVSLPLTCTHIRLQAHTPQAAVQGPWTAVSTSQPFIPGWSLYCIPCMAPKLTARSMNHPKLICELESTWSGAELFLCCLFNQKRDREDPMPITVFLPVRWKYRPTWQIPLEFVLLRMPLHIVRCLPRHPVYRPWLLAG